MQMTAQPSSAWRALLRGTLLMMMMISSSSSSSEGSNSSNSSSSSSIVGLLLLLLLLGTLLDRLRSLGVLGDQSGMKRK